MHLILDGAEPDHPRARHVWMVAQISREFRVLPSVAEQALLDDADGLILDSMMYLNYAQAKAAFESAKSEDELQAWKDSMIMDQVKRNTFDIHKERVAARRAATEQVQ